MKHTNYKRQSPFFELFDRKAIWKLSSFLLLYAAINGSQLIAQTVNGCARIDSNMPTLYMTIDTAHSTLQSVRLMIHNNISCSITLTTIGSQLIVTQEGKQRLRTSNSPVIEDGASIALSYMIRRNKQRWNFISVWKYGHVVNESILESKKTVGFIVPAKYLKNKGQIVVPFNYEWEGVLNNARSSTLHLIHSPIKLN